jgi:hypothetical protein
MSMVPKFRAGAGALVDELAPATYVFQLSRSGNHFVSAAVGAESAEDSVFQGAESALPSDAALTLIAVPSAVTCAGLLVARAALDGRLDRPIADAAVHLMRDLTAHAVDSTGAATLPATYSELFARLPCIGVRVSIEPQQLILTVWDVGVDQPVNSEQLSRVAANSDDWGYYYAVGGRVVWCALQTCPSSAVEADEPLHRVAGG